MALTYFLGNTVPIAIAIALTTKQSAWRVWQYGVRVERAELPARRRRGRGRDRGDEPVRLLADAPARSLVPLYLTYKMYRAGVESEARQGAILEAAHDAIITMDQDLNIREFNPAAEQMFGYPRTGRARPRVDLLLPPEDRQAQFAALQRYTGDGRRAAGRPAADRADRRSAPTAPSFQSS